MTTSVGSPSENHTNTFSWERPQPGCPEANFDGSLDAESFQGGLGFLLRDREGNSVRGRLMSLVGLPINKEAVLRFIFISYGLRETPMML